MVGIEPINLHEPASRSSARTVPTAVEKWYDRVLWVVLGILGGLSLFYKLPKLAFLCCFPTFVPFFYFFVRDARNLAEPWMRKTIIEVVAIHAVLLVGIVRLWRTVPILAVWDWTVAVAFGIVVAESIVVATLLHFQRPK